MIKIDDSLQLDDLEALREVVKALERRFPDHNGPFEYGTRLAEEVGELIEVLYEAKDGIRDNVQKDHLIKEQQDVLRVVLGILEIYSQSNTFPATLNELLDGGADPKNLIAYIVRVGVEGGELANAVNHAEGMGVKKDKHGDDAQRRVLEQAKSLAQVVAWTVRYFNAEQEFKGQIAQSYRDYREKGYINISRI